MAVLYLAISTLLTAFGLLAAASIGLPFLLLGVTLLGMYPLRDRRDIFLPILFGELAFFLGAALIAPWSCRTQIGLAPDGPSFTECDNPVGIAYQGEGLYNPPLWPALVVGVAVGLGAAVLVRRATRREVTRPS